MMWIKRDLVCADSAMRIRCACRFSEHAMTLPLPPYNRDAARKPVNLSLNEDLVARARGLTRNLSGKVEELLADFVQAEIARKRAEDEELEAIIDALNAVHEEHGFLSDEFPSF
jgi:antitoxin CcdA